MEENSNKSCIGTIRGVPVYVEGLKIIFECPNEEVLAAMLWNFEYDGHC